VASLLNTWLVSGCEQKVFRLYFGWTRGRLSEMLKALLQKWFLCYHLPWSFKIFINVFAFLFVKENSKEICEEISFPFFQKMLMSAFLLRFNTNYLEKMCGYPNFSLWIPMALAKIYFFRVVLTWHKNLCI